MTFRIRGLSPDPFRHLYGLPEAELAKYGAIRMTVDKNPGFPDRIEMRELDVGERVLLLNHTHQPAPTPYHASHAIFVREGATQRFDASAEVPDVLRRRLLSLRSFDEDGMMLDADVVDGSDCETLIERLFLDPCASYIHAHYAKRGCFACRIDRS